MVNKTAVQFRKSKKTAYIWQRLKYCKSCGQYDVLFDDHCPNCRAQHSFVSAEQYASTLHHRLRQAETFTFVSLLLLSLVLARDLMQLCMALAAGITLSIIYFFLLKRCKPYFEMYRLNKILRTQVAKVGEGLAAGETAALADLHTGRYKEAYEKLREVGAFLNNDRIKLRKILCLNHFIIRKDMELELESLIPNGYEQAFIVYLYEVSKVNRQLIRQSVLDYVMAYREQIELLENGKNILTNVIAASLRMKHLALAYRTLIIDYVDLLPKERFLRLCKMIAASPGSDWGTLADKCKETTRIRYSFDPDFQGIW